MLILLALETGAAEFDDVDIAALWTKSCALFDLFAAQAAALCRDLTLVTPTDPERRGSHISFTHPHAHEIVQAAIAEEVIGEALAYVLDNLTGDVRLPVAAAHAGMSESAFSRYFKRASGLTFTEMVGKLRLTQAAALLVDTDRPVHAIATDVGYANLSNFNCRFLDGFGLTPTAYRKQNRRAG